MTTMFGRLSRSVAMPIPTHKLDNARKTKHVTRTHPQVAVRLAVAIITPLPANR
jgi:hypothetical protein